MAVATCRVNQHFEKRHNRGDGLQLATIDSGKEGLDERQVGGVLLDVVDERRGVDGDGRTVECG
jgi:hypothetical protein